MDTRLRVGRAIAKTEEEVAPELMQQVKRYAPDEGPPAMSTDGKGAYREAMLETWGKIPEYCGRGAPPKLPQPGKDWQYLQVIKKREGGKVISVTTKVIYGNAKEVKDKLGCHTAYVERTNLTSRTMNGRLVRKTLSFSKELRFLTAASALEDAFYNFTRPVKTLRVELSNPSKQARWQQRTPAMAVWITNLVTRLRSAHRHDAPFSCIYAIFLKIANISYSIQNIITHCFILSIEVILNLPHLMIGNIK